MKLTIQPRGYFTDTPGPICRVWEGTDQLGQPMLLYIAAIAIPGTNNASQYERDLIELPPNPDLLP
jgi:hypothetical protein